MPDSGVIALAANKRKPAEPAEEKGKGDQQIWLRREFKEMLQEVAKHEKKSIGQFVEEHLGEIVRQKLVEKARRTIQLMTGNDLD